jgi:hypothetical protein
VWRETAKPTPKKKLLFYKKKNNIYLQVMKTYLIIFAVIISIATIAGIINHIAEKNNPNGFTANISSLVANGFGLISVFMFVGGLLCLC